MLQYLKIANLALLEQASIDFESGFTVVTGETGAGKSVFLGALSLLSGSRSDKSIIRSGEDCCEVEASLWFEDCSEIDAALSEMDLPLCEDGSLLLKRSLRVNKPSRISINGSLATLANLQELGGHWIDFHGPGEPQRLLRSECQLELIDLYAHLQDEAEEYAGQYAQWRGALSEMKRLQSETQLSADQAAFLKEQMDRIDSLELSAESVEQLEQDFNRVASSQELLGFASALAHGISGDDGVVERLSALARDANQAAELDPSLAEQAARLESLILEAQELGSEYDSIAGDLNFEPEFAAEVNERMTEWQELRRKYGRTVEDVLKERDAMARRLEDQGDIQGALNRLMEQADAMEKSLKIKAARLTEKRLQTGRSLVAEAEKALLDLGFKKGRCSLEMIAQPELKSYGNALPQLLFAPNVGEPLKPLAKVASSGELARVMLALKTLLADVDRVPVLVFDEVDANVGGEIGRSVGKKMAQIGQNHQVFCITHLPQVASLGRQHFVVTKDQSGERARVSIDRLDDRSETRVRELARMLGDSEAASAQAHAKELLETPAT